MQALDMAVGRQTWKRSPGGTTPSRRSRVKTAQDSRAASA
jgi:hypothetical protein